MEKLLWERVQPDRLIDRTDVDEATLKALLVEALARLQVTHAARVDDPLRWTAQDLATDLAQVLLAQLEQL
jgi:hypothetical protein